MESSLFQFTKKKSNNCLESYRLFSTWNRQFVCHFLLLFALLHFFSFILLLTLDLFLSKVLLPLPIVYSGTKPLRSPSCKENILVVRSFTGLFCTILKDVPVLKCWHIPYWVGTNFCFALSESTNSIICLKRINNKKKITVWWL